MIYCNTEDEGGRVRDDGVAGPSYEPGRKGVSGPLTGRKGKAERQRKALLGCFSRWAIVWGW